MVKKYQLRNYWKIFSSFYYRHNDYQHALRVLHPSASSKSFSQLLDILTKSFMFLKIFNLEFLSI